VGDDTDTVARIEGLIVSRLVKRLRVEAWYEAHAGIAVSAVEGPVVVFGLPRTGTTAVHYLLALDDRFRYLRAWELRDPVPPNVLTESEDPRRAGDSPASDVRHIQAADGPVEDGPIHEMSFLHGELVLPVPSFTSWWRQADHSPAFAYHERMLHLLHFQRPPRLWLLKMPTYLFQIPDVVARYPGARFVVTHRDPAEALASTCSTVSASMLRRLPAVSVDPCQLGNRLLDHFAEGMRRALKSRATLGSDRFIDVSQGEVEEDPAAMAERIYSFLGMELYPELRAKMVKWADANKRGSRGEHRYRAEDYGLTNEAVRRAFAGYLTEYARLCRPSG
jgi:hypothetical protein